MVPTAQFKQGLLHHRAENEGQSPTVEKPEGEAISRRHKIPSFNKC